MRHTVTRDGLPISIAGAGAIHSKNTHNVIHTLKVVDKGKSGYSNWYTRLRDPLRQRRVVSLHDEFGRRRDVRLCIAGGSGASGGGGGGRASAHGNVWAMVWGTFCN